jgi:FMN phosphatase YigB (HAD superfamily)
MIKAVLFDFGDTLVFFDKWDYDKCLRKMLESLKKNDVTIPVSYENFKRVYFEVRRLMYNEVKDSAGEVDFCVRLTKTLERLHLNFGCDDPIITDAADAFFEGWDEDMRIDDCVFPVLEELKANYRLGIITNFPYRKALLATMKRFDLSRFFEAIVISAELGVRKPNPRIFEKALRILDVKASDAVFVGDTLKTDIFGAQNVGMKTVLVENARLMKNRYAVPGDLDCVATKPDCTIVDLRELTGALASMSSTCAESPIRKLLR